MSGDLCRSACSSLDVGQDGRWLGYRDIVITQDTIESAAQTLADAARSPATVILFGSHARGGANEQSDLDFLVIEKDVDSRLDEMVRLRDALPPLEVSVDVLVFTEDYVEEWKDVRGTVINAALSEGRVLVEA